MRKIAVRISLAAPVVFFALACGNTKVDGSTTSWHLEEYNLSLEDETSVAVIADCRGNNQLSWQIRNSDEVAQPAEVEVYCGMYAGRPAAEGFKGWGWTKANWPQSDGCTYDTARIHGKKTCGEYYRALRDEVSVNAPWCKLGFKYDSPVTTDIELVTYCVTR